MAPGINIQKLVATAWLLEKLGCHPEEPLWLLINDRKACKGAIKALYSAETNQLCMLAGSKHATLSTTECHFSFGQ